MVASLRGARATGSGAWPCTVELPSAKVDPWLREMVYHGARPEWITFHIWTNPSAGASKVNL
eukprot:287148-Lingulodinium_polyedra.AAC.1